MILPRCPRCEFSYAWDGHNCTHCHLPIPTRASWASFASLVRFDYAHPKRDRRKLILFGCGCVRRVEHLFPPGRTAESQILDLTERHADGGGDGTNVVMRIVRGGIVERPRIRGQPEHAVRAALGAEHAGMMCENTEDAVELGFREAVAHARAAKALAEFPYRPWKSFPLSPDLEDQRAGLPDEPPAYNQFPDMNTDPRGFAAVRELNAAFQLYGGQRWRAEQDEESAQCRLYRDVFGYPFATVEFAPAWRTSTVLALSRQMYESRDFTAMPILADALQDAGCEHDEILEHCRGGGEHVRGCWVVDHALGKV